MDHSVTDFNAKWIKLVRYLRVFSSSVSPIFFSYSFPGNHDDNLLEVNSEDFILHSELLLTFHSQDTNIILVYMLRQAQ